MFPEAWHAVGRAPLLLESVCLQMVLPERRHATAEGLLLLERVPHPAAGRYCNRGGAPRGARHCCLRRCDCRCCCCQLRGFRTPRTSFCRLEQHCSARIVAARDDATGVVAAAVAAAATGAANLWGRLLRLRCITRATDSRQRQGCSRKAGGCWTGCAGAAERCTLAGRCAHFPAAVLRACFRPVTFGVSKLCSAGNLFWRWQIPRLS